MKLSTWIIAGFAAAPLAFAEQSTPAAAKPEALGAWLEAHKLASAQPDASWILNGSDAKAAPVRVVICGRAAHGTQEIGAFDVQAFEAISKSAGFEIVAADCGWTEALRADEFVQTGKGDVDEIVRALVPWGWNPEAARKILSAMRAHNANPDAPRKRFVGLYVGSSKELAEIAQEYIYKVFPEGGERTSILLAPFRQVDSQGRPRYAVIEPTERYVARVGLGDLLAVLTERKDEFIESTSPSEYGAALDAALALGRIERVLNFEVEGGEQDPRGLVMAENLAHVLEQGGANTRALVFAHARDLAGTVDPDSFAHHAAQLLPDVQKVAVVVAAGGGAFLAVDPNDRETKLSLPREFKFSDEGRTELERVLATAGKTGAAFDLRTAASGGASTASLSEPKPLRLPRASLGGESEAVWDLALARDCQILVWIERLSVVGPPSEK